MEIKNISKKYAKKQVLLDINLSVFPGECIGILGGNGSGKSTLLGILAGTKKSDSGEFLSDGTDLLRYSKVRCAKVGYVPQSTPLFEELSAFDNLLLWYTKEEIKKELDGGVLSLLGINKFIRTPVSKMSGGMKKRLSIGCSVAANPDILLLDEPTAALDLVCKADISEYIKNFKAKGGCVIIATHDISELPLCDRLFMLKNGVLSECTGKSTAELIREISK